MATRGVMSLLAGGPPLDPSSQQARQWLVEELRKPIYHTEPGLWERFKEWLLALLNGAGPSVGAPPWVLIVLVALILVGAVALLARNLRRSARMTETGRGGVLEEQGMDAAAYRVRAAQAAVAGDHDGQLLDSYRALAASALERTLLGELPGRTAHEVALELSPVFPDAAHRLREAADSFDAVRYGGLHCDAGTAAQVAALDVDLAATRPLLVTAGTG